MEGIPELAERLRIVLRFLKRRAQSASGPDAPTPTETSVLGWLDEKGALTPSALSAAQNVRPQTMGQALDLLAARDWVRRGPHPTDRRQVLVSLTPAGRKALAKGRRLRQAWLVAELGKLPARDRRAIAAALTVFERILQPDPHHESSPNRPDPNRPRSHRPAKRHRRPPATRAPFRR